MFFKKFSFIFCFLLGLSVFAVAQSSSEWYQDKLIVDIQFTGLRTVSETELSGIVRPYISKKFTDALSWEIQGKLYALEYFDLILPQVLPGDADKNTVILSFDVKEKPVVNSILFEGNNRIRKGELLDSILLTNGDMYSKSSVRQDVQAIKNLYLEKGFVDAEVSFDAVKNEDDNTMAVTFKIVENQQTTIKEIRFVGNDEHFSDKVLKGVMKTKPQSLFNKGVLKENELQADVQRIETYYWDRGFIDAKVEDIKKEVEKDPEDGSNKLIITLVITEGEIYTYGGITFDGNTLYSTEELTSMISQKEGAVFNKTRFRIDYQKITDLYYENGYIYNTFSFDENKDEEAKVVSYAVHIIERERAHIENIIIRGNTKTKDFVINRELPFEVGDVFSKAKVMSGIRNLYNTQFFSTVEPQTYPGSEEGLMDLVIDVEEGKTADIVFGISFSGGQDFPLSGNIKWNDKNFLGRGSTLGFETLFSPDDQSFSFNFSEPRVFNTRFGVGFDLTYRHSKKKRIYQDIDGDGVIDPYVDNAEYEENDKVVPSDYLMEYESHYISAGANSGYTWNTALGRFGTYGGLRSGVEYVTYDDDVYRPWSDDIRDNLNTWKYHDSAWSKVSWDTRDFVGSPSKGFIISERATLAGLLPRSSKNYLKSVSRADVYFTLFNLPVSENWNFKSILSLHTAFSFLGQKPWDPSPLDPQEDGFYADGMFVARGWYPESDGQSMWDNTVTLTFPIAPNVLAYDFFFDAVGIWKSKDDMLNMSAPDFKFSLGTGIRFDNPQFPIGIYLVKKFNINPDGSVNWNPEPDYVEFKNGNLDLVVSFSMDIY